MDEKWLLNIIATVVALPVVMAMIFFAHKIMATLHDVSAPSVTVLSLEVMVVTFFVVTLGLDEIIKAVKNVMSQGLGGHDSASTARQLLLVFGGSVVIYSGLLSLLAFLPK